MKTGRNKPAFAAFADELMKLQAKALGQGEIDAADPLAPFRRISSPMEAADQHRGFSGNDPGHMRVRGFPI